MERQYGDIEKIKDPYELKDKDKLLLERLKGLVKLPIADLWIEYDDEDDEEDEKYV